MLNEASHILGIIARVACGKHEAALFEPCYVIPRSKGEGSYPAICNKRAKDAGANGKISKSSYSTTQRKQVRKTHKKSS